MYASFSRGMRGVAIEIGTDEGRDVFRRLAAVSDVVIENFGATVMANWGCSHDDLLGHNSRLVMVSLSGYGRTGPRAGYLAYGSNIANFTGIGDVWWTNPTYGDFLTAAHAAAAILAARRHVADTGEGVLVDASQVEVVASMAASLYLDVLVNGERSRPHRLTTCSLFRARVLLQRRRPLGDRRSDDARASGTRSATSSSDPTCMRPPPTTPPHDVTSCEVRLDEWAAVRTTLSAAHLLSLAGVPAASVANTEESYHDPQLHHRTSRRSSTIPTSAS